MTSVLYSSITCLYFLLRGGLAEKNIGSIYIMVVRPDRLTKEYVSRLDSVLFQPHVSSLLKMKKHCDLEGGEGGGVGGGKGGGAGGGAGMFPLLVNGMTSCFCR